MTRFARAKGSKASNEKVAEDATPWSELKKGVLIKEKQLTEETKQRVAVLKRKAAEGKPVEWVSLDEENDDSLNVLRNHLQGKKKKKSGLKSENSMSKKKKKKKQQNSNEGDTSKTAKISLDTNIPCHVSGKRKRNSDEVSQEDSAETNVVKTKKSKVGNDKKDGTNKEINNADAEGKGITTKKGKIKQKTKKLKKKIKDPVEGEQKHTKKTKNEESVHKPFTKLTNKVENSQRKQTKQISVGGKMVKLVQFQGFYVTADDGKRLKELRKKMVEEGIPQSEIKSAIKLERRRCEKHLARMKKNVCFQCREPGHLLSECPKMQENIETSTGICYKCGSTEHKAFSCKVHQGKNFPFAKCFLCKEMGHIARECPDNERGLYPRGGCCKLCGDVTHLKKDCPTLISEKEEKTIKLGLRDEGNLEGLEDDVRNVEGVVLDKKQKKLVKF